MGDNMNNEINIWRQQCLNEVSHRFDHELSFRSRRYLLEAFDQLISENWSGAVKITRAHFARAQLAILCANKVLPIWEQNIATATHPHPHRILQECEAYFDSNFSYDDLNQNIIRFNEGLDNANSREEMLAYPVGRSTTSAASVVLDDELIMDEKLSEDEKTIHTIQITSIVLVGLLLHIQVVFIQNQNSTNTKTLSFGYGI
jgi:hypothetical protein